jgi:hypothetical protein
MESAMRPQKESTWLNSIDLQLEVFYVQTYEYTNKNPLPLPQIVQTFSSQKCCSDNYVTKFISGKRFGLVYVRQRGLEGNATVGRQRTISSYVIDTLHGAHFRGLSILNGQVLEKETEKQNALHNYS